MLRKTNAIVAFLAAHATTVAILAIASPGFAQGFEGGELSIDAYGFSEGDDLTATNYTGALQFGITDEFSIAADISGYDFSLLDDSVTNITLHGIYRLDQSIAVGAFVGSESTGDDDSTLYGVEAGYDAGPLAVEGYVASYDDDDDSSVLALSGAYRFNQAISAIADIGYADLGDIEVNRISVGGEYSFDAGPDVYAEIGSISTDDTDGTYIGIGASITFGANDGTTFGQRSIFEAVNPGF